MIIQASAPGRCGIIGNPSDIYGGVVVSCSVPARATCRLTFGESRKSKVEGRALVSEEGDVGRPSALAFRHGAESNPKSKIQNPKPDTPGGSPALLWLAATARFPVEPCLVKWSSEVPKSSGLAGSTALLAATLACVLKARGESPDLETDDGKALFAELVRDVESKEAGVVCGYQDAYMAVFGGLRRMDFAGKHPIEGGPPARLRQLVREPAATHSVARESEPEARAPFGLRPSTFDLPFLLVTTGIERLSGNVHVPMRDRWLAGDRQVIEAMERIAELGRVGSDDLEMGDWSALADAMNENQRLVASLGGSGEQVDRLVRDCLECGALGAKLAGAGLGGTVIALTENAEGLSDGFRAKGYSRLMKPSIAPGVRFEATVR